MVDAKSFISASGAATRYQARSDGEPRTIAPHHWPANAHLWSHLAGRFSSSSDGKSIWPSTMKSQVRVLSREATSYLTFHVDDVRKVPIRRSGLPRLSKRLSIARGRPNRRRMCPMAGHIPYHPESRTFAALSRCVPNAIARIPSTSPEIYSRTTLYMKQKKTAQIQKDFNRRPPIKHSEHKRPT